MTAEQDTAGQTLTEQTVDWADPAVQDGYLRLHRQDQWRTSRASLTALALLTLLGAFQLVIFHTWVWLIVAGAGLGLILLRVQVTLARLRSFLPATGGLTRYRLEDRTLHIQNAAGDHEIPLGQMNKFRSYPAAIVVQYAGTSTFTLPDGPLRRDLERRLKQLRSTAPGGTP